MLDEKRVLIQINLEMKIMETKDFFTTEFYEQPELTLEVLNRLVEGKTRCRSGYVRRRGVPVYGSLRE